jgi:hypothetical protein
MNVQMRIITDENVDQLLSMSYSNNINKLLQVGNKDLKDVTKDYTKTINDKVYKDNKIGEKQLGQKQLGQKQEEEPILPEPVTLDTEPNSQDDNLTYKIGQEVEVKNEEERNFIHAIIQNVNFDSAGEEHFDVLYDNGELEQQVPISRIRHYNQGFQGPQSSDNSPPYASYVPNSPEYAPNSPAYNPTSPPQNYPNSPPNSPPQNYSNSPPQNYSNSPQELQPIQIQIQTVPSTPSPSILDVTSPPKEESKEGKDETTSSSETKKINISDDSNSNNSSNSSDTSKKITL